MADLKMTDSSERLRSHLLEIIRSHFDLNELKTYCFELGIDFDELSGDNKVSKARELILFAKRTNQLAKLIEVGNKIRDDIDWPEIPTKKVGLPTEPAYSLFKESIEAMAGDVKLSLTNVGLAQWELAVANYGKVSWSKAAVLFNPPHNVIVRPQKVTIVKLQANDSKTIEKPIIIRPNQESEKQTFRLSFKVVLQATGLYDEPTGILEIPT